MFEEFLDSVLIVDDKYEEVEGLEKILSDKEIWVTNGGDPEKLKDRETPLRVRKLLIIDLYLRPDKPLAENIGVIRQILTNAIGKDVSSYGILLWTKHEDEFIEFEKKVFKNHNKYTLPLFCVSLSKTKYLKSKDFSTLFEDILEKLSLNKPASFFISLDQLIKNGKSKALHSFYDLAKESESRDNDLVFLLDKIGTNYSGAPTTEPLNIENEVVKAFCDMLYYDITNHEEDQISLFDGSVTDFKGHASQKKKAFAIINSKLHLDFEAANTIFPGSIFQLLESSDQFRLDNCPENATKILIEITPPCDFASGHRKNVRLIGGFLTSFSNEKRKKFKKSPNYYSELSALEINGFEESQFMVFDFHYFGTISEQELKNSDKYKYLMRVKNGLMADIIQKFSAYASRLGIANVD